MDLQAINEGQTTSNAVDLITEKPIKVTIPRPAKTLLQRFKKKLGLHKEEMVFYMEPLKVGVMFRISAIVINMPNEILQEINDSEKLLTTTFLPYYNLYYKDFVEIVALALTNDKKAPSEELRRLIVEQFDMPLLLKVLQVVVHQMRLQDFLYSIVLIKSDLNALPKASRE